MKEKKRIRQVHCLYARDWIDMGRARTKCPRCGAEVGGNAHPLREYVRETDK